MIYLVMGYATFWLVTFVFVYTIFSRQQKLNQESIILKQLVKDENE